MQTIQPDTSILSSLHMIQEFHSISNQPPYSIFSQYFEKSTKWLNHLKKFGGNHECLYRTISRMPNSHAWIREEKCIKDLSDGKIEGFYIVSDILRGPVIICNFNLYINDIMIPVSEHLTLTFNPTLQKHETMGFYSYVCDETESTPEFMNFFKSFINDSQLIIQNSYENPTEDLDYLLVKACNFIKEVNTFPENSFRIGQFDCNIYAIYKKENHVCWIFLNFVKNVDINTFNTFNTTAIWFDNHITDMIYIKNQNMFENYFEKSKNSIVLL
jgi:hypothetical protein